MRIICIILFCTQIKILKGFSPMKKNYLILTLIVLLFGLHSFGQVIPDGQKTKEHVNYLASDAMKGRKSGTPEYQKAAEYVAQKMKEFGLQPGGENDTYFQQVSFKNWRHFEPPVRLEILTPKKFSCRPGRNLDFFPNSGTGSGTVRGQLVFVGYGLVNSQYNWNDYENVDVKGKIVLIISGAPDFMKKISVKEKTLDQKIKTALKNGAAGVLLMNIGEGIRARRFPIGARKGTCPEGFVVLTCSPSLLDKLFYMSNLSWRNLVSRTLREKRSFSMPLDVEVEMEAHFTQEDKKAPNVLGLLPGKHPELKKEYILIGGHLDHLGVGWDGTIFNGADDNAASVSVILEIARVFQANNFQPDRSIVFIAWAGEELGLVGSRYYTNNPLYPLDKTVVYMNMDMIGLGDDDLFVGGMWEFSDFYDILKKSMKEKFKEKLNYRIDYRGSDHSAFLPKGVTAISLRTGNPLTSNLNDEHPEYHKPGDDPAFIRPELLQIAAEYHIDLLTFLAECKNNLLAPKHHIYFIHKDSSVVDMHCDTISRFIDGEDLTKDNPKGHIDIPKLKEGAVDLQVFACYVGPPREEADKHKAAKKVFHQIDAVHELVEKNPDDLVLVKAYGDLRTLRGNRKTGILIGIEGGYAIENDLRLLRSFHKSGVRLMTLTHWLHTDWADASGDPEPQFGGLTEFGEEVVKEMNKLGMVIDVSHVHDETFWDVIRITDSPVVASHSCCRALSDYHRNLSDKMLKALAKNGGVIGINFAPFFLDVENSKKRDALRSELLKKYNLPEDRKAFAEADPERRKRFSEDYKTKLEELNKTLPEVSFRTVVDHIEHVIKVTGNTNHVGLGSDFDGIGNTPTGLEHIGNLANITAELVKRGHKDQDIRKILGGNFIRVFRRVTSQNNPRTVR
jgi:membrane dipeptidase